MDHQWSGLLTLSSLERIENLCLCPWVFSITIIMDTSYQTLLTRHYHLFSSIPSPPLLFSLFHSLSKTSHWTLTTTYKAHKSSSTLPLHDLHKVHGLEVAGPGFPSLSITSKLTSPSPSTHTHTLLPQPLNQAHVAKDPKHEFSASAGKVSVKSGRAISWRKKVWEYECWGLPWWLNEWEEKSWTEGFKSSWTEPWTWGRHLREQMQRPRRMWTWSGTLSLSLKIVFPVNIL